jgi:hypothetical protein
MAAVDVDDGERDADREPAQEGRERLRRPGT